MTTFRIHYKNGLTVLAEDKRSLDKLRKEIATKDQIEIVGSYAYDDDGYGKNGIFVIDTIYIDHIEELAEGEEI